MTVIENITQRLGDKMDRCSTLVVVGYFTYKYKLFISIAPTQPNNWLSVVVLHTSIDIDK